MLLALWVVGALLRAAVGIGQRSGQTVHTEPAKAACGL